MSHIDDKIMTYAFCLAAIDNETIEEEMAEDDWTYVTLTRKVDLETGKKLLSQEYSNIIYVGSINSGIQ